MTIKSHFSRVLARAMFLCLIPLPFIPLPCRADLLTPFVAYSKDFAGTVKTNPVTIEAWTFTNTITGVSTNLVLNFSQTYYPAASDGYFAGYLAPGNYRLTVESLERGALFGVPSSTSTQNLAQLATGIPIYAFMNWTLAQFTDAGTAAYSNASAFFLSALAGTAAYSNAAAFTTPLQFTNLFQAYAGQVSNLFNGAFIGDAKSVTNLQPGAFTSGTNGISETATLMSNFVNRSQSQTISGDKTFLGVVLISNLAGIHHLGTIYATNLNGNIGAITGGVYWTAALSNALSINGNFGNVSNGVWYGGALTNVAYLNGNMGSVTGGLWRNPIVIDLTLTNGVNYGTPFRSPGSGSYSEQFGTSASASANGATAIGYGATASAIAGTAFGTLAAATAEAGLALGQYALASGVSGTAVGDNSVASATNTIALGQSAEASWNNSVAIGAGTISTRTNQIMLGTSAYVVTVPGSLEHLKTTGTNSFSDLALRRYAITSLANGNNSGVIIGTNSFVEVSGPSAAFTLNGMTGSPSRDGHLVVIVNQTGFDFTVAHQSGTDPVAANRIITLTGADRTTTGNGAATFIYSAAASRWLLIAFDP